MNRLKISDGDLLIVSFPSNFTDKILGEFRQNLAGWLRSKGLDNVNAIIVTADTPSVTFQSLSVNDVFEDTFLKGKNNNG